MESQYNSDSLVTMLFNKIKGESQPDYTIISLKKRSPLHGLTKEYKKQYPERPIHSKILISEITDSTARHDRSCPKLWIEAKMVAKLLSHSVLQRLLNDNLTIEYNDGKGSYYDQLSMKISLKGAQDFIHEIGHYIWNRLLIGDNEPDKRAAVNKSLNAGSESRKNLPEQLIPDAHKKYAELVGAYSGQFLENPQTTKISNRKNDLEEHFARNYDYLMRGRPLDVTHSSKARIDDMLNFFINYGLIDAQHLSFYMYLLKKVYREKNLNAVNPKNAADGVEITRDELFQYHKLRIMFKTGKSLNTSKQISLALDLSEDFVRFCIAKEAFTEIREALKQKGILLLKI